MLRAKMLAIVNEHRLSLRGRQASFPLVGYKQLVLLSRLRSRHSVEVMLSEYDANPFMGDDRDRSPAFRFFMIAGVWGAALGSTGQPYGRWTALSYSTSWTGAEPREAAGSWSAKARSRGPTVMRDRASCLVRHHDLGPPMARHMARPKFGSERSWTRSSNSPAQSARPRAISAMASATTAGSPVHDPYGSWRDSCVFAKYLEPARHNGPFRPKQRCHRRRR